MQNGAIERRFVSVREAQTYSGLSHDSLDRLIRAGRLKAFRPRGGKRLIELRELDAYIRQSAVPCASDRAAV